MIFSRSVFLFGFLGLMVSPPSVLAESPSSQFSIDEVIRRLEVTEKRLAETEQELGVLRQSEWIHQQAELPTVDLSPLKSAAIQTVDFLECDEYCDDCGNRGPCQCDGCADFLSWNKECGWRVEPFGKLEAEMILSNDSTVSENYIVFAVPRDSIRTDQIDITGQSTQIGLNVSGPRLGSFQVGGLILMDFHGNRPSRNEPGAYFIRGYAELVSDDWRIAFGQMGDTIEGWNAEVVNWQGLGGLGYIGANQRGTFRVDRFLHPNDHTQWTISGALTQPVVTDLAGIQDTFGQDNGLPNFEGKVVLGLGDDCGQERPLQLSIAGMYGEYNAIARSLPGFPAGVSNVSEAYAIAGAMQWNGEVIGARGQIWQGRGIGTYMGGVSQSLNLETGDTIHASGGYGQLWAKVYPCVTISAFAGIDNPRNRDLSTLPSTNQRQLNQVVGGNVTWNVTDYFHLRCDVMGVETDYVTAGTDNDIVAVLTEASITF